MSFFNTSKLAGTFSHYTNAVLMTNEDVYLSDNLIAHTSRMRVLAKQVAVELDFVGISRKRFKGVVLPRVKQVMDSLARSSEEMSSVKFSEVEHTAEKRWKLRAKMSVQAWEDELLAALADVTVPGGLKRLVRRQSATPFADPANVIGFDLMLGAE